MAVPRSQLAPSRHVRSFHNTKGAYADHSITHPVEKGRLSAEDARLIRDFIAEIKATHGIGVGRANKLIFTLVTWRKFIGPFRANTIADIYRGIEAMRDARNEGVPYKQNTQRDFLLILKRFSKWLIANGHSALREEKIAKIKAPRSDRMTKTAQQMLTEEEVRAMIDACQNSRDRAIIATIYEGGFRVEEIGRLTWGQVKFDDYGTVVNVDEKTGKPRYVRLLAATQYLIQWKNDFPFEATPDALVFLSNQKLPLQYPAVAKQFKIIAARAGIRKKITPHLFRHSRITAMIREGYSESTVMRQMWGSLNSTMFPTYLHLTDNDTDNEIFERQGIRRPEAHRCDALAVKQCVSCNTVNPSTYNFCKTCGEPLDETARLSLERLKKDIEQTPEYKMILSMARQKLIAGT
ncbi:tyrosine-type recombinase/integrase [Methanoregula sp.]|uniref:tyrosine-type recombinase/integrase n=1 Tax=Methanoregula sp. TaxID=2052170 RepID=UPI003C74CBC4